MLGVFGLRRFDKNELIREIFVVTKALNERILSRLTHQEGWVEVDRLIRRIGREIEEKWITSVKESLKERKFQNKYCLRSL